MGVVERNYSIFVRHSILSADIEINRVFMLCTCGAVNKNFRSNYGLYPHRLTADFLKKISYGDFKYVGGDINTVKEFL